MGDYNDKIDPTSIIASSITSTSFEHDMTRSLKPDQSYMMMEQATTQVKNRVYFPCIVDFSLVNFFYRLIGEMQMLLNAQMS